jgi:gliding motility-associated lipoprotein GldH
MTRGTNNILLLSTLFLFMLLAACRNNVTFSDSRSFRSENWNLENVAEFSADITDTASISNIFFTVRTGSSYPFRNLWLFVSTTSPSGKNITDTLQYMLADEKGKWYGRGLGDVKELNLPFRTGVYFPEKGLYRFAVRHGMRSIDLKGIYDLGIRIEKAKK